jgi:hypothetical protein
MSELKSSLYKRISEVLAISPPVHCLQTEAKEILKKRCFGFSYIRLLPKSIGVRPILNLGRQVMTAIFGLTVQGNKHKRMHVC